MKISETWDLIAPVGRPDVIRAATLLASQLAEVERYRVRLFLDVLDPLVAMNARIDPELWLQPLDAYELVRLNLALVAAPADNIVRLFGAKMPRKYIEHAIYGHSKRKLFNVRLLDQPASSQTPFADASNLQAIEAAQGDQPWAAGMIRERHSAMEIRVRWKKTTSKLSQATFDSLGFDEPMPADALFILCWGAAIPDWDDFVMSLGTIGPRPIVLLVNQDGNTPATPDEAGQASPSPSPHFSVSPDKVRVLKLPATIWRQRDELVWMSDIVMTGHDDMAQRAAESGVPLVWLPSPSGNGKKGEQFIEWYSQGADQVLRRCLRELTSMRKPSSIRDALGAYLRSYPEMEKLAAAVAKRVARTPLMSRMLPALTPAPPKASQKWALQHHTTIPQPLPDHA